MSEILRIYLIIMVSIISTVNAKGTCYSSYGGNEEWIQKCMEAENETNCKANHGIPCVWTDSYCMKEKSAIRDGQCDKIQKSLCLERKTTDDCIWIKGEKAKEKKQRKQLQQEEDARKMKEEIETQKEAKLKKKEKIKKKREYIRKNVRKEYGELKTQLNDATKTLEKQPPVTLSIPRKQFKEYIKNGFPTKIFMPGLYDFIVKYSSPNTIELLWMPKHDKKAFTNFPGHSTLLTDHEFERWKKGQTIIKYAGEISLDENKKLTFWSSRSGHFHPPQDQFSRLTFRLYWGLPRKKWIRTEERWQQFRTNAYIELGNVYDKEVVNDEQMQLTNYWMHFLPLIFLSLSFCSLIFGSIIGYLITKKLDEIKPVIVTDVV
eukprot:210538_1